MKNFSTFPCRNSRLSFPFVARALRCGFVAVWATLAPFSLKADVNIGNGKLYYCKDQAIFLAKNDSSISEQQSRKKMKRQVALIDAKIRLLPKG
ncbi:MAG: hypothetical protein KDD60_09910, partial [Bdellovibrionales bacterium]|nr:hypothetical protein [Bdellovibrionales bacterium]